ncbi:MAG TPA: hypothetical protein VNZ26_18440 [Vicinamibacterales bacterium]|nr:hypothetical protein [Vicinamibacterales bacterium]
MTRVRAVAVVSAVYDAVIGIAMLVAQSLLSQVFAVPLPSPPIHADLNGVFLLAVAGGYLIPYFSPRSSEGRAYLWTMGTLLKGAGALTFVLDHYFRGSPNAYLLFAVGDGTLAVLTTWVLVTA